MRHIFSESMRPKEFSEVYGNKTVISKLSKLLKGVVADDGKFRYDKKPAPILFSGISGVGKTTLAFIVASKLGVAKQNVIQVNAGSEGGVDSMRYLIDQSKNKLIGVGLRVFIIDEAHKLTSQAQDALLIDLENMPKYAYFMLCTTNPSKLLSAIKTRTLSYKLKALTNSEMVDYVVYIAKKFELSTSLDVLKRVVLSCSGSPRMALNLIEKVKDCKTVDEADNLIGDNLIEDEYSQEIFSLSKDLNSAINSDSMAKCFKILLKIKQDKVDALAVRNVWRGILNNSVLTYNKQQNMHKLTKFKPYNHVYTFLDLCEDVYRVSGWDRE